MHYLIRDSSSQDVIDAVERAAKDACDTLYCMFNNDQDFKGDFHATLSKAIMTMLHGKDPLVRRVGDAVPRLAPIVFSDSVFGNPEMEGEAFLLMRMVDGQVEVLAPFAETFSSILELKHAWPSFAEAADAGFTYCDRHGVWLHDFHSHHFAIVAVERIERLGKGFRIVKNV